MWESREKDEIRSWLNQEKSRINWEGVHNFDGSTQLVVHKNIKDKECWDIPIEAINKRVRKYSWNSNVLKFQSFEVELDS